MELSITSPVVEALVSHALTTESEEIMGLLLGEINGRKACIWGCVALQRIDRKSDRVEVSPEIMMSGASRAEEMSKRLDRKITVVGWYHSHPHITILPSHVDVKTQWTYQMMEPSFIGVIVSCFDTNADGRSRIQMVAFRSIEEEGYEKKHVLIPYDVVDEPLWMRNDHGRLALVDLQRMLLDEEKAAFVEAMGKCRGSSQGLQQCHNLALWQKMLCQLAGGGTIPLLHALESEIEKSKMALRKATKDR